MYLSPQMRNLFSELLLAQSKKVKSECFATLNANLTEGKHACPLIVCEENMNNIEFTGVNLISSVPFEIRLFGFWYYYITQVIIRF